MLAFARRWWLPGFMAVVFGVGLLNAIYFGQHIGTPFGGFIATRNHTWNLWQIDSATPAWWSVIATTGLRYDDQLVTLDGQPYGPDDARVYARAVAQQRSTIDLGFMRDGQRLTLALPIQFFTLRHFLDLRLAELLTGLGFWLLAVAIYNAQPTEQVNRSFAFATALAANSLWTSFSARSGAASSLLFWTELWWAMVASFIGVSFAYLVALYPQALAPKLLRWFRLGFVGMAGVAGIYVVGLVLYRQDPTSPVANALSAFSSRAVIVTFGLGVLTYLWRLPYLIWHPMTTRRVQRQALIMLAGVFAALPYVSVIVVRSLAPTNPSLFFNDLDLRYLVLAVPLTFAFVILRYQAFQSTHPVLVFVFILASSALIASVGAWALRLIDPRTNELNWPPFVPLFLTAFSASFFWSRQQSQQRATFNRLFQWERRSYLAIRRFGHDVAGETGLKHLPNLITAALVSKMELERAAIWLWEDPDLVLVGQAGKWGAELCPRLTPERQPQSLKAWRVQGTQALPVWLEPLRAAEAVEVIAPLRFSGEFVGLLGFGKRWDQEIFDERDLEMLDLIAQQSALFIVTAQQVELLRQVPQQIATAQERERFKIAQELHDTVQQFLGRLPFYLEVSRSSARTNPAETESILQRIIAEVEAAAQTVRQIRNNLAPLQLEQSFVQPLLLLIEQFRARSGVAVEATIAPEIDDLLSPNARHALYRVVQQALDNVAAHSGASYVVITIQPDAERVLFAIRDDGRGVSAAARAQAEARGSFGLKSMQTRITALDGECEIVSSEGAGVEVRGWLPAGEE